jgi:hypothetical protein
MIVEHLGHRRRKVDDTLTGELQERRGDDRLRDAVDHEVGIDIPTIPGSVADTDEGGSSQLRALDNVVETLPTRRRFADHVDSSPLPGITGSAARHHVLVCQAAPARLAGCHLEG